MKHLRKILIAVLAVAMLAVAAVGFAACSADKSVEKTYVYGELVDNSYGGHDSNVYQLNLMSDGYRNLLYCASLLHDIGEMISYSNHNVLSQVIIENADLVGFTVDEIRAMGLMVRFHHKKFPGSKDPRLSSLPREDALAIRQCAMFLKIADVADRHRNHTVSDIRLVKRGDKVLVELVSDGDTSMELWSLEKVRPDFRKLFGLDMVPVRCSNAQADALPVTNTL